MINSEMEHSWRQEGNILLRDDERIDDLQRNHYGIIQRKGTFCFGMDAVLLSGFAVVKPGERRWIWEQELVLSHSFRSKNRRKALYRP